MKQIGDYIVLKQMEEGTTGTLYLAQHRFLKRPFAVKVLSEELQEDSAFVARLESKVATLAALDHPHIVKLHNVGAVEGRCLLVTDSICDDSVQPLNLAQYLREHGALSEEEIVQLAEQLAAALDYAHPAVIHGGIKPSNILLQSKGQPLCVLLSDFGLTSLVDAHLQRTIDAASQSIAFRAHATGGLQDDFFSHKHLSFLQSYAFLAPEQRLFGDASRLSPQVDVFAFGVLLYFLLMGEYPEGFFELPSQRLSLRRDWDPLLCRCLHKDPSRRPSSLCEALRELLSRPAPLDPSPSEEQRWAQLAHTTQEERSAPLKPLLKPQELLRPQYEPDPGALFQTQTSVVRYQPDKSEAKEVQPLLTEMVIIPEGHYLRGSNQGARDEAPRHEVHLSAFAIDIHPVTNEQFVRFLEAMGGEKDANNNDMIRLKESRLRRGAGRLSIESGYAKHPAVGVTWYGAMAYAKWIGKRLPTEAQWEVAALGGASDALYPFGSEIDKTQANFFSSDTTAVMTYAPTGYGLYDLAGNVYEWCEDWYDVHYYSVSVQEPDCPKGPAQGVYRVLRGGCWKSLKEDLRCAHRHRNNPGIVNSTYGFRCAADVV